MKSIAVLIHARTKSTRCPNKHLREFGETTLIDIALSKLGKLKNIEEKYLAVHEQELKVKATTEVPVLEREYAAVAPGNAHHSIMYKHLKNVDSEYIINFNPCQPFLNVNKLQKVIDWFKFSKESSFITVKKQRNFYWFDDYTPINFTPGDRLSTTSGPYIFSATHSLVGYKKSYMLENWELFPNLYNEPFPYLIDWSEEELIDIDTELDFKLAKLLFKNE
tara:strand:+ start:20176 stop:20838 length:663 start_codon:yes stop_codon:yes gene_type:complete